MIFYDDTGAFNLLKNATDFSDFTDSLIDSRSSAGDLRVGTAEHHARALHCLSAMGLRLTLLFNLGTRPLQFKHIIRQTL